MASYDNGVGMWKSKLGRYFTTQSEAIADERNQIDDSEFMGTSGIESQAPDAAPSAPNAGDQPNPNNPGGISDNELRKRQDTLRKSAAGTADINANRVDYNGPVTAEQQAAARPGGATGAYESGSDASRAAFDYMHQLNQAPTSMRRAFNRFGESVGVSHAGDAVNPGGVSVSWTPEDLMAKQFLRQVSPTTGLGTTVEDGSGLGGVPLTRRAAISGPGVPGGSNAATSAPAVPSGAPDFSQGQGRTTIDQETADAKNRAGNAIEQNRDENAQLFADAFKQYDDIQGSDYGMSDEARGYQREGLQQQRMLLQKMLGFDEDKFAQRYADRALAGTIAAGRSAGGGYAGQQAGMFAAQEQAPGLYAEGQRQATALANQRLGMAETAAKGFGDLGTMTRGQDEARQQFESNLSLGIADSVARLTEGNVQMNDRDSQQMAEIWMDFAKLQSVYAGMTSDEQLAWWREETARRGQDQNMKAIEDQLKAQGKVSSKDIIGGLFQLGGGLITTGGTLGAAAINSPSQPAAPIAVPNATPAPVATPAPRANPYAMGDYDQSRYAGYA